MPRKKKVIEEVSPDAAATQETMTTDEVPAAENAVTEESPNPTTESPYVTTADVIKTLKPDEVVTLRPITDPNTPLSKITVFDGVEDADDSLTYRIPASSPAAPHTLGVPASSLSGRKSGISCKTDMLPVPPYSKGFVSAPHRSNPVPCGPYRPLCPGIATNAAFQPSISMGSIPAD